MNDWKLVPCEPTEEMIKAVNTADCHNFELSWAEGYKAMIDAAPVLERVPESSGAYDMLDRFLRNSLDDTDYAQYSDALETVLDHVPTAQPAPDVQPAIYPEEARQMGLEEVPYYTHPPVADVQELVEALKDLLYQAKFFEDEGGWDFEQAQAALAKWEGK